MAWTSLAARTALSTKRVLSDFSIEMGVRDPGELEWRLGGVSDIDGVEQRPPREGLADGRGPEQQRSVHEGAAGDLHRVVGAHSRLLQHRVYFAPSAFEFVRHVVSS